MAEKEYIERKSLISDIKELPEQERIEYMGIYDCIKSHPTADVQEVVRCGFCKHYKLRGGAKWCVLHMVRMHSDDYCSYGAKWIRSEQE